ncbi:MAG: DinB family protein [Gemmatimonadota bacterium]
MPVLAIGRPQSDEYAQYYAGYISQVPEDDPVAVMEAQAAVTRAALRQVTETDAMSRYAPGKWSIKEVVGHLADTERIMAYRALRFARCDEKPLQGFEQNDYVLAANFDRLPFSELMQQLADLRRSTVALFRGLDEEAWGRRGIASGNPFTVRALAFVIPGHERHHLRVLQERYGVK